MTGITRKPTIIMTRSAPAMPRLIGSDRSSFSISGQLAKAMMSAASTGTRKPWKK